MPDGDTQMPQEGAAGSGQGEQGLRLSKSAPLARALVATIHAGEVESLMELLGEHPGLASARTVDDKTPLHWAASSDDVEVARALIDGGADIEATGASIAGGTPLDDAVGYGCWRVARLLVERGARVDRLWHASALGMMTRVEELLAASPPTRQQLTDAFWQACHGGERRMAEHLLSLGADLNGTPSWGGNRPLDAADGIDTGREALVNWLLGRGPQSPAKPPPKPSATPTYVP
jgi:ankyrin repeat protein